MAIETFVGAAHRQQPSSGLFEAGGNFRTSTHGQVKAVYFPVVTDAALIPRITTAEDVGLASCAQPECPIDRHAEFILVVSHRVPALVAAPLYGVRERSLPENQLGMGLQNLASLTGQKSVKHPGFPNVRNSCAMTLGAGNRLGGVR